MYFIWKLPNSVAYYPDAKGVMFELPKLEE
jgi:hypothetical protein